MGLVLPELQRTGRKLNMPSWVIKRIIVWATVRSCGLVNLYGARWLFMVGV